MRFKPAGKRVERQSVLHHSQRDLHQIILRRRQGVSLSLEPEGGRQHGNPLVAIEKAVVSDEPFKERRRSSKGCCKEVLASKACQWAGQSSFEEATIPYSFASAEFCYRHGVQVDQLLEGDEIRGLQAVATPRGSG